MCWLKGCLKWWENGVIRKREECDVEDVGCSAGWPLGLEQQTDVRDPFTLSISAQKCDSPRFGVQRETREQVGVAFHR